MPGSQTKEIMATVESAIALTQKEKNAIKSFLLRHFGPKVEMHVL